MIALFVHIQGVLLGFRYGLYVPVRRSSVRSRKFTTFLLASISNLSLLFANILHSSFLMISVCLGVALQTANPSSLYRPTLILMC